MSKKKNKVRFGLKNAHYAKATFDEDGNVSYGKPVRLPGAVSLSLDPEGENENFWADDVVYFVLNNNAGYEGDLELALIPEEFLKEILHEEEDSNGVLTENANNTFERFALLFEFTGDKNAIRHVLYCCSASRPSLEGQTKEDEKEVQTETLSLIASALANGFVKAKTSANTSKETYNKWYDEVYLPEIPESSDDDDDEDEPTGNGETGGESGGSGESGSGDTGSGDNSGSGDTGSDENGTTDDETAGG